LKAVLLELLQEDKAFCRAVAKEIGVEEKSLQSEDAKHEEELTTTIHKIFDKHNDVFKVLA